MSLFSKGGFAMWPLLACSVIGVAIILERSIYLARLGLNYDRFLTKLKALLRADQMKEAIQHCRKQAHPAPRLAETYLKNIHLDSLRQNILRREGSEALEKVEGRLKILAAITHIAPLLGLLGTVTGLVTAFHEIELRSGAVQPGDLAAGIWEALITTVFGLIIAIPCMAAYHSFEGIADQIARRMQFIVSELDEFFGKKTPSSFAAVHAEREDQEMEAIH